MKVEIWHRKAGPDGQDTPEYDQGATVEVTASGDASALELTYLHVKEGSVTSLQDPTARTPKTGDIFRILDSPTVPRAYALSIADCACEGPQFSPVVFVTEVSEGV